MAGSLTSTTINAAKWTYLSTSVTAALQIIVTAVLARLVAPEAFGLIAMSALVLRFGQYFAQMGVGQAIVQRPKLEADHASAGFWASVVIGALFCGVAWLLAPLASRAFGNADLIPVLRWMSLSFLIAGTSTTSFALLRRAMRFKAIALTEIAAYAIGFGGALVLAATGAGVWALVFAGLCQTTVASLLYNLLARPVLVPVLRWQPYRELLGFGTTVSFVSFLEFLNLNLDTIVVGRVAGAANLGYYTRALSLTGLPMHYMSTSLSRVLLPSFSRAQDDPGRIARAYLTVITVFAGIGLPVGLGMSGAASDIVAVLLGPKWIASVPVMRIVAVASVAGMLSHFGGILLEATARLKSKVALRLAQLTLFAAALFVLGRYGLVGFAAAFAISETAHVVAQTLVVNRVLAISAGTLVRAYRPGVFGGLLTGALLYGESLAGTAVGVPSGVVLALQVLTGMAVLLVSAVYVDRGSLYRTVRSRVPAAPPLRLKSIVERIDGMTGWDPGIAGGQG